MTHSVGYILVLVSFTALLTSACISAKQSVKIGENEDSNTASVDEPFDRNWERIYFRGVDERLVGTGIQRLENQSTESEVFEVRFWAGFSTLPLRGLLLAKRGENSSAIYLRPRPVEGKLPCVRDLGAPRNGWLSFWQAFDSAGIAILDDSGNVAKIDESSVVVEVSNRGDYRTYHYPRVSEEKGGNYARLFNFAEYIKQEFGVNLLWEPMPDGVDICHD